MILTKEKINKISNILNSSIEEKTFPGCSFAYVTKDSIEVFNFGNFTYDLKSEKVDDNTIYDIASLTKTISPMCLMMILIDQGRLRLDDYVSDYLDSFKKDEKKKKAKIIHILTYVLEFGEYTTSKDLISKFSPEELEEKLLNLPLKYNPGEINDYSNTTSLLAAKVVEKVCEEKLDKLTKEEILDKLEMTNTFFSPDRKLIKFIPPTEIMEERGEVKGFVHDELSFYLQQGGIISGAAGLFAPSKDIAKFLQVILNSGEHKKEKIFSEEIMKTWTNDNFPNLLPVHTPAGWGDFNNEYKDTYHQNIVVKGGFTGCFMMADLKKEFGFVVLSNRTYPKRPENGSGFKKVKDGLFDILMSD